MTEGLQFRPSADLPISHVQRDDEPGDGGSAARAAAESARPTSPVHKGCTGIREGPIPLGPDGIAVAAARCERTRGHRHELPNRESVQGERHG